MACCIFRVINAMEFQDLDDQKLVVFRKLLCHDTVINCRNIVPLVDAYSPLATSFDAPILAGETLYPSVEHHVAALLLRDVQRLEAVRYVPLQLTRNRLRQYLRESLLNVPLADIENWKKNRMYSALKAATELKFAQYPELRALLIQTGDSVLLETPESQNGFDCDWTIGVHLDALTRRSHEDSISPVALVFFTMHPECKPCIFGSNMTGRLLMELRRQFTDLKNDLDNADVLQCPACTNSSATPIISEEIVILAGQANPLTFDYPSTFVIDGHCYFTVEHYVKCKMLEEFGYVDKAASLKSDMDPKKPSYFKKATDFMWASKRTITDPEESEDVDDHRTPSIAVLKRWARTRAVDLYETALAAKFSQNNHILRALLATGDSLLVELRFGSGKNERAKFETFEYGAFIPVHDAWHNADPAAFVKWTQRWKLNASILYNLFRTFNTVNVPFIPGSGKNRLGMLLMDIRQRFKSGSTTVSKIQTPSLHQFFADFLLQLTAAGQNRLNTHLQRVNSFIVKAPVDHAWPISVDGRCNPLSIFYLAPFTADDLCFPTLEHYRWWKFFEHEARLVQCVPGFWDHTDGRQLRAICQQWTNENLGLNASTVLERYKTDVEFDVLRNGALCKHSQNPHILPVLFDGISYGPIIAGESEGDGTFGIGMAANKLKRLLERWKISPGALTLWWTSLKVVKPSNIGDNLYGLALMSARDEIFALYCERAAAKIPMAPSVKSFNEITSDENYFFNDLDPMRVFVFTDDHDVLGLNSPVIVGEITYSSVIHYLLNECFSAIDIDAKELDSLDKDSIWQLLFDARKLASDRGLKQSYDDWFNSTKVADTLKFVADEEARTDSSFRDALLATGKAFMITVINVGVENDDSNVDSGRVLTMGLSRNDLIDFLRDIQPQSTLALQFWTRCEAVLPGRLGMNLWAACLMAARSSIVADGSEPVTSVDESCFWNLDAIPESGSKAQKRDAKRKSISVKRDSTEAQSAMDVQTNQNAFGQDEIEDDEAVYDLIPMPDTLAANTLADDTDRALNAALQPTLDALRRCTPLYDRIASTTGSEDELKEFGERLGKQILSMFGSTPDLSAFTDDDMYNLGRIAACQFHGSQ